MKPIFSIENLDMVLNYPTITLNKTVAPEGSFFNRTREFEVNDILYRIEWWCNGSYLYCGNITVPFNSVCLKNTWPHNSKMNLQFYDADNQVCCVIKIDDWN